MASQTHTGQQVFPAGVNTGYAAILGGLINIVIAFTGPTANVNEGLTIFWVGMIVQALATGLMLYGLYGLHRRYEDQYGRLGLGLAGLFGATLAWLTFSMLVTGIATVLEVSTSEGVLLDIEGSWFFVNLLAMPIASLYGIVLWRREVLAPENLVMAGTFPIGIAVLLVLLVVSDQIGLVFWVPLGLAWIALGYGMVRER